MGLSPHHDHAERADRHPMEGTLAPLITAHVRHRLTAGEVTKDTAASIRSLLGGLDRAHGRRPLAQFGPATIDRWRSSTGHLAPTTRALYLAHVRTFCAWLHRNGHITHPDPAGHVRPPKLPRRSPVTFTGDDVAAVLEVVQGDRRATAIVRLLYDLGLRCVEVSRLQVDDYDPRRRTILIVGKGGHERVLPVPESCARALDAYLDEVGRRAGPLVRSLQSPNRGLGAKTISIYGRRWIAAAGLKTSPFDGRSPHGFRRTAGSELMEASGDIRAVQELLGHSQIETTARYYLRRVSLGELREAMEGRSYLPVDLAELPDAA